MKRFPIFKLAALPLLMASAGLFSAAALADGATNDTLACYEWDQFPNERLNLNIRGGGPLSSSQDETNYNHPPQRTHGVHAKHVGVCGEGTSGAVEGVVVVAAATGAHMGLHSMVSRGTEKSGGRETCRPVFLDCVSEEAKKAPDQWTCKGRNEFGTYHGESRLTLVAMDTAPDDPLCAVFEDDDTFEASNKGGGQAVASGTLGSGGNGEHDDD
ncbi:MAG: hypothetical protein U9Q81_19635 [Pseudomonadota bacterium]|nr:hypothetical protein [Pseudomonadota bacterium]